MIESCLVTATLTTDHDRRVRSDAKHPIHTAECKEIRQLCGIGLACSFEVFEEYSIAVKCWEMSWP